MEDLTPTDPVSQVAFHGLGKGTNKSAREVSWRTDERQRSSTATGKEVKWGSESTGVRGGGVGRKRVQKSPFFCFP